MSLLALPASAELVTVANTGDDVNGSVTSITALLSNPGLDGISLREAVEAVNNTPGEHTIEFSPAVEGEVISLQTQALSITRDV